MARNDHTKETIHAPPEMNPVKLIETDKALNVEINFEAYLPYLEDKDISDEDKHALIEAVFRIMGAFVDFGFGIHPVQTACGQTQNNTLQVPQTKQNPVKWSDLFLSENFETAAEAKMALAAEKAAS